MFFDVRFPVLQLSATEPIDRHGRVLKTSDTTLSFSLTHFYRGSDTIAARIKYFDHFWKAVPFRNPPPGIEKGCCAQNRMGSASCVTTEVVY